MSIKQDNGQKDGSERLVHLIKHGLPVLEAGTPAHAWVLSERGRTQAREAAAPLRARPPAVVVSSEEPKARETAALLAEALGVPWRAMLGLHEQLRYTVPLLGDAQQFRSSVRAVFARPSELVFGEETGDEAHARFAVGVRAALAVHAGDVAIVAHGTVIALLVARANGLDAGALWESLSDLSIVTVAWPSLRLVSRHPG